MFNYREHEKHCSFTSLRVRIYVAEVMMHFRRDLRLFCVINPSVSFFDDLPFFVPYHDLKRASIGQVQFSNHDNFANNAIYEYRKK